MPQVNRATLKGYFNQGDIPTEGNFSDLIDSVPNITDDGPTSSPFVSSIAVDDWSGTGDELELVILAASHLKGISPSVQLQEGSTDFTAVSPHSISINATGDITVSIAGAPAFAGRAIIS